MRVWAVCTDLRLSGGQVERSAMLLLLGERRWDDVQVYSWLRHRKDVVTLKVGPSGNFLEEFSLNVLPDFHMLISELLVGLEFARILCCNRSSSIRLLWPFTT